MSQVHEVHRNAHLEKSLGGKSQRRQLGEKVEGLSDRDRKR